ncbi:MAG: adenosylcobinamide-GDP ribazoletransferase [Blastocatellia bacterium]
MAEWLRLFLIATQFLTRLPVPEGLLASEKTSGEKTSGEKTLGRAARFFPLVGAIVGGGAALAFLLLQHLAPHSASVLCAIIFAVLITNGFHEDGLADTFDGLGGGWTKEQALEIMRDSRLGTYGALALIFLILGKHNFLSSLPPGQVWRWLIVAHTASRWTSLPLCAWLPYARADGQGKLVARQVGRVEISIGSVTLLLAVLLLSWKAALVVVFVTGLAPLLSGAYFRARLSGVTGDCLGAANQLTEVALYLAAVILLRFDLL